MEEVFDCLDRRCSAENKALIARNMKLMRDMGTFNERMPYTKERRKLLECSYANCYNEEMKAIQFRKSKTIQRKLKRLKAKKSLSNFIKAINYAYLNK